ncbi:MAG: hypothetical protein OHK0052_08480 [Anaerolineales bacterium]
MQTSRRIWLALLLSLLLFGLSACTASAPTVQFEPVNNASSSNDPALQATAQALANQTLPISGQQKPVDIPTPESPAENFSAEEGIVSFNSNMTYAEVVAFYNEQMPQKGWRKIPDSSFEFQDSSLILFQKDNRQAMLAISVDPQNGKTVVLITISTQ